MRRVARIEERLDEIERVMAKAKTRIDRIPERVSHIEDVLCVLSLARKYGDCVEPRCDNALAELERHLFNYLGVEFKMTPMHLVKKAGGRKKE